MRVYSKQRTVLQQLADWSENWTDRNNPFNLFLDLTGYSESRYGEMLTKDYSYMGYTEYVLLGDALKLFEDNGYETIYQIVDNILDYID